MNKSLNTLVALSADDLLQKIASRKVSVPPHGSGQTHEHGRIREAWVAFRFLHTIAKCPLLSYPIRVEFSDKPDLILVFERKGQMTIGIEITEATSQNSVKLQVELERDGIDGVWHIPEHKWSDSQRDLEKQRKIYRGELLSPPIMGDAIERNWHDAILGIISKKTKKVKHPEFRCYLHNWLLIYDNWTPHIPDWEVNTMITKVNQHLSECSWQHPFDRIFLQGSERMWKLC